MKLFADYFLEDNEGFTCFKDTPELVVWEKKVLYILTIRAMIYLKASYLSNILILWMAVFLLNSLLKHSMMSRPDPSGKSKY
jgi:hypothetical protein